MLAAQPGLYSNGMQLDLKAPTSPVNGGLSLIQCLSRKLQYLTVAALAAVATFSACDKAHLTGSLTVRYLDQGTFEIYKIASEQPLQFVSETSSKFNERISLTPGSYMVLADCSSEVVNIYPGSDVTLVAHRVNFLPLQPPSDQDKFSIQCVR